MVKIENKRDRSEKKEEKQIRWGRREELRREKRKGKGETERKENKVRE